MVWRSRGGHTRLEPIDEIERAARAKMRIYDGCPRETRDEAKEEIVRRR